MIHHPHKGFTLLVAMILTSVLLSVGLALLDIALKQVTLSSSARQSQYAFYAADSAMECALYWDQKMNVFRYDYQGNAASEVRCAGLPVTWVNTSQSGGIRTSEFDIPCAGGGTQGSVQVFKNQTGITNIYASGFNSCSSSNPRRVERGLKVFY